LIDLAPEDFPMIGKEEKGVESRGNIKIGDKILINIGDTTNPFTPPCAVNGTN